MIVTVQTSLIPEDFDLDHEIQSSTTGKFIFDTWNEVFKNLSECSIIIDGATLSIKESIKYQQVMTFTTYGKDGAPRRKFSLAPLTQSNIGAGEKFGSIFNAIAQQMPEKAKEFEINAFNELLSNPNAALKYVGTKTLLPTKIECLIDGVWKIV